MGRITSIATIAISVALSACSTYVVPPIEPDEPTAELYGTGNFGMLMPQVDKKGCYQTNLAVDTAAGATISRVRANKPLVISITGSVGPYACRAWVRFNPQAGRRYVAHGLVGPDSVPGPQQSFIERVANPSTAGTCHIEVYDETDPANAGRVETRQTKPHQRRFACIAF